MRYVSLSPSMSSSCLNPQPASFSSMKTILWRQVSDEDANEVVIGYSSRAQRQFRAGPCTQVSGSIQRLMKREEIRGTPGGPRTTSQCAQRPPTSTHVMSCLYSNYIIAESRCIVRLLHAMSMPSSVDGSNGRPVITALL